MVAHGSLYMKEILKILKALTNNIKASKISTSVLLYPGSAGLAVGNTFTQIEISD